MKPGVVHDSGGGVGGYSSHQERTSLKRPWRPGHGDDQQRYSSHQERTSLKLPGVGLEQGGHGVLFLSSREDFIEAASTKLGEFTGWLRYSSHQERTSLKLMSSEPNENKVLALFLSSREDFIEAARLFAASCSLRRSYSSHQERTSLKHRQVG